MKRNVLNLIICLAAYCLLATQFLSAQTLSDEMISKFAAPLIENKMVDGVSIGYIQGKKYGTVHLGHTASGQAKANNNTIYEIGSISKVFTSLLLADAVVRDEIDLKDAATLNNSAGIELPSYKGQSISWLDLSTHRSGLPRLPDNMEVTSADNPYQNYDSKKAAAALNALKLTRSPGQAQEYSNFAVSVLGYLVGQNAGKSYQQLLRYRIAKPLGMRDCTVAMSDAQKKRLASPHKAFGSPTPVWAWADLPGAGGVRASMKDMMRFARAQLYPPKNKLGEAIELAWKQHTEADGSGPAMGLGWTIMEDGETRWHNGQVGGSHSMMLVNRKNKTAIIVLSNTASTQIDPLAIQLMQQVAGDTAEASIAGPIKSSKVSPFASMGFLDDKVSVIYQGKLYFWREIDGIPVADVIAASKKQFGELWQRRIRVDLVELLWSMNHKPQKSVKLLLQDFETKKDTVIAKARMTKANREILRQEQRKVDIAEAAKEAKEAKEELAIDADLRARLEGRYKLGPDFIFDVQDQDGHLMASLTNQPFQEVFPDSAKRWSYRGIDATLEFKLRKKGQAKSLVLHQNGIKQTFKRMKK